MMTIEELKEKLVQRVDEVEILELLNILSSDLVEAFHDRIEEKYEELVKEYDD